MLFIPAAQDCGVYDDMQAHLAEYSTSVGGVKIGMTGTMDAVGLYSGASGCSPGADDRNTMTGQWMR